MRLLIVDDHTLFREGLAAIIRSEPDVEIVGLAGTVQQAITLARETRPEIILMDFEIPDGSGPDATRAILAENPGCKIVFLTIFEDKQKLIEAVRAGAKGYLLKNMRPAKLVAALRSVYQGEGALSRTMTLRLMEELSRTKEPARPGDGALTRLTQREVEVLQEIALGATNQEISRRLFLSENTVKHHIHSILDKLNVSDRREASHFARQHGLVK